MSKIFDSIKVSEDVKRQMDHSFAIADQIHFILQKQNKTQRDLAKLLGKKESEISKWMTGRHNFTTKSIAKIETVLGEPIIMTTNEASKKYSSSRLVPVKVYTIVNSQISKNKSKSIDLKWEKSKSRVFDKGLKIA